MRHLICCAAICCAMWGYTVAGRAQTVAVKTNALYWAGASPNAGVEIGLTPRFTLDLSAAYNPWNFKKGMLHFWLAQPEARYWFCERFEGHFVGIHAHAAQFYGEMNDNRYDGYLVGGGFSYGYAWILSPHWNMEATIGVGYARLWYDQSECLPCNKGSRPEHKNYVGPTKIGLSISYIF